MNKANGYNNVKSAAKHYGSNGKGASSYGEYGINTGPYPEKGVASYRRSSIRKKLYFRVLRANF